MNHIESAAYLAACATMTGAGFRQCTMPFQFPVEFLRDFEDGTFPIGYQSHMAYLTHLLHDNHGLNVEVHCLSSQDTPRKTVVAKFW